MIRMKTKNLILIFLLIAINFSFLGCNNKKVPSATLNTPSKINLFVNGKQKQITEGGSEFDKALFDRINTLINIRIPKEFSAMEGVMSEKDIKEVKVYAVEFIYDKLQTVTINNGNRVKVEYSEIIFPLSEKWQNTAFIVTKDNSYIPVGLKENLDHLVKASVD